MIIIIVCGSYTDRSSRTGRRRGPEFNLVDNNMHDIKFVVVVYFE